MKTARERLTSIADCIELLDGGHITEIRAIMLVHGVTSAHIHDLLMARVADEFDLVESKDTQWTPIPISQH